MKKIKFHRFHWSSIEQKNLQKFQRLFLNHKLEKIIEKFFDNFIGSYSFYKILNNGTINFRLVKTLIKSFSFGNPFKEFLTLNLKIYT